MWRAHFAVAVGLSIANMASAQPRIVKPNYGEPNGTFPNWQERAVAELTNRARSAPATDLAGCPPGNCAEAACYAAAAPVPWRYELNQSARFHSATMGMFPFFAHDTPCVLFTDIASRYPGTSDGSFASSCSGSGTTLAATRINNFAGANNFRGENIAAGYTTPFDVFYAWLYEATADNTCGFHMNGDNGHRVNILTNGPALGVGYQVVGGSPFGSYWTQDFGLGPAVPKIPSGSHWTSVNHNRDPQGGDTTVEFWANWYDVAGPNAATVVIDNVPQTMTLGRGSTTNGAYMYSAAGVSTACHTYYFAFVSSTLAAVRYPDTGSFGFGNSGCADFQNTLAPAAPTGVVATATSSTTVHVSWNASATATSYQIFRRAAGGSFGMVGTSMTLSFDDSPVTANSAFLYRVRAINAGGSSPDSAYDLATTVIFNDDPLVAGSTIVQAVHLSQLRAAIEAVRALAGSGAGSYTDSASAGVVIKAVHVTEMRSNLEAAMGALGFGTASYTDPSLSGVTVKTVHFQELRNRVK